jgi:hypothetical protein
MIAHQLISPVDELQIAETSSDVLAKAVDSPPEIHYESKV